jgi:hypothetical protein
LKKIVSLMVALIVMIPTNSYALPSIKVDTPSTVIDMSIYNKNNLSACTIMRRGLVYYSYVTYYLETNDGFEDAIFGFYMWNSKELVKAYKLSNGKLKTSVKKSQVAFMKLQTEFVSNRVKTLDQAILIIKPFDKTISLCESIGN